MMTSPSDESANVGANTYTHISLYRSFFEFVPSEIAACALGIHVWIGDRYIGWFEGKAVLTNWPEDTHFKLPTDCYMRPAPELCDIPF